MHKTEKLVTGPLLTIKKTIMAMDTIIETRQKRTVFLYVFISTIVSLSFSSFIKYLLMCFFKAYPMLDIINIEIPVSVFVIISSIIVMYLVNPPNVKDQPAGALPAGKA